MDQPATLPQEVPQGDAPAVSNAIAADDFVWLLHAPCRLHRLAFDAALVRQQFPPPYGRAELIEAARALGFRAGETAYLLGDLPAARSSLEKFVAENPGHRHEEAAWSHLGDVSLRLDDLPRARQA